MTCEHAIELLPWLLNGTLDAQEAAAARRHLEGCRACREVLRESREAWSIFDQHLPPETLVALSYGDPPTLDASLAERHLASCPRCAAELELARMSRRLEEDDRIAVFPAKPARKDTGEPRTWRNAALAAGLTGVVALGGWLHSAQRVQRIPELEARNQQIQQEQRALESQVKEARSELSQIAAVVRREPQINTWTDSVYVEEVVRGQQQEEILIPSAVVATPTLVADPEVADPRRRIEIADAAGKVVWTKEGLRRDGETNDYTVTFFPGFLKAGRYTIRLYTPDGTPRETYKIRVE